MNNNQYYVEWSKLVEEYGQTIDPKSEKFSKVAWDDFCNKEYELKRQYERTTNIV